jgi:hypothetical protein
MYTATLSIIAILTALLSKPSSAEMSESSPTLPGTQSVVSVTYKNSIARNSMITKASTDQSVEAVTSGSPNIIAVRGNNMSMSISRVALFARNDHFSSAVYAPMQNVNHALSLIGTVFQTRIEDSMVTWIQALSLLAKRQINTELSYSIQVNDYSKLDSVISYRLDPNTNDGKPKAIASLQYHIKL